MIACYPAIILSLLCVPAGAPAAKHGVIASARAPKPAIAPRAKPAELLITPPRINPAAPPTQPFYPDASRRFEEEGRVVLGLTILADGSVGNSWVETSSGYSRLDRAAIEESLRWRFIPAMKGSRAVVGRKTIAIKFALTP